MWVVDDHGVDTREDPLIDRVIDYQAHAVRGFIEDSPAYMFFIIIFVCAFFKINLNRLYDLTLCNSNREYTKVQEF